MLKRKNKSVTIGYLLSNSYNTVHDPIAYFLHCIHLPRFKNLCYFFKLSLVKREIYGTQN